MDELLAGIKHLPLKFSRNKLTVHIDAANPSDPVRSGLLSHAEIYIPEAYQSPNYSEAGERVGSEKPVSQLAGLPYYYGTDFDIQTILDGKLFYQIPSLKTNDIQVCTNLTIPFKVRSFIEKDNVIVAGTESISTAQYCIKAGLKADDYAGWKDAFFTNYFDEHLPFLTNQQNDKEVSRSQPEYLYFLVNFLPKPTTLKLRIALYFSDGTTETITSKTLNGVIQYSVYLTPTGFTSLGLSDYETDIKKIVSYEVWLNNQDDNRISEKRSYLLDDRYQRNVRYLLFSNSLGGYDSLRCLGVGVETLKVTRQLGERELDANYLPSASEIFISGVSGRKELNVNTGFLDADNTEYLTELILSEDVYVYTKDGFIPIVLADDSYISNQDNVDLASRIFTFLYAKSDIAYSLLPTAPTVTAREIRWEPSGPYCVYNSDTGLANGFQGASTLTLVYADTGEPVKGVPPKSNTPGTEGYVQPQLSNACADGYAPFKNIAISRLGTFRKNDCIGAFGDFATIQVAANTFGGLTQEESNSRAEEYWSFLNTQDYANTNGGCIALPEFYTLNPIPSAGKFNFRYAIGTGLTGVVYIHGGLGVNGGTTDLVYGNHWAIVNNTNPNSIIYPSGKNDCILPSVIAGTYYYIISFIGWSDTKRMRFYVNGELKEEVTVTPTQFQANGGSYNHRLLSTTIIPSQATVYCVIEKIV